MSKVALRTYNRDIENLIDHGQIEEAVAHCQHILKSFPKHLETYRLMGKAYLESHRYADAADIFQRVLLAAPDDFVSHLGMSIVCDEQKDLNGAIWHMERGFEINSTNSGVQAELRRLVGRRDGMEPPKIFLTRGALAQIYVKGAEYQQAIAEIKSVLAEDPSRNDMKTLLARAYYRAGLKNEAVELSIDLIKQYPYSLDGNRILVEILPGTSMAQGVEQYRRRIQSLDPYAAVSSGSVFETDSVPDVAVEIEKLDWDPNAQPADGWSMPAQAQSAQHQDSAAPAAPAMEIPGWMQQSGWGPSTGEFKDGPINFDEPEAPVAGQELAAAEIPEWLKAMAPPGATSAAPAPVANDISESDEPADFDWLAGLGAPTGDSTPKSDNNENPAAPVSSDASSFDDSPADGDLDWLNNLGATAAPAAGMAVASDGLDWLNDLKSAAEEQPAGDAQASTPDWLGGISAPETSEPISSTPAGQPSAENVPDWLSGLSQPAAETSSEEPVGTNEVPDWLSGLSEPASEPASEAPIAAGDVPDWLSGISAPEVAEPVSAPPAENVPDWLSGLSEPASEPASEAPIAAGDVPDWLGGISAPGAAEPVSATTADQPVAENVPDWLSGLPEPASESASEAPIAAGDVPDWLGGISAPEAAEPVSATPAENVPDWLSGLTEPASESASEAPIAAGDVPDWLAGISAPEAAEPVSATPAENMPDWLSGLSEPASEPASEAPIAAGDVPDWLSGISAPEAAEPVSATPAENVPDWMSGLSEPVSESASEVPGAAQDVPDWLNGLADPVSEAQPAQSTESISDWLGELTVPQVEPQSSSEPAAEKPKSQAADLPEQPLSALVSGPGTSESEQDAALLWLESLAQKQGAKAEELITNPQDRRENAPEWVSQGSTEPAAVVEPEIAAAEPLAVEQPRAVDESNLSGELSALVSSPGTSESEQDAALLWLESLAQKQGAKAEELITNPEDRRENAPEWVSQGSTEPAAVVEPEIAAAEPPAVEQPRAVDESNLSDELSALVSGPGTSESEQDAALLWLESLAQKQGAKDEELITNPADRFDVAPDWVSHGSTETAVAAEPEAAAAEPEVVAVESPAAEQPRAADESNVSDELSALVSGPGTSASEQDAAMLWLESLAQKQGAKADELITNPEDRLDIAPDWVTQGSTEPTAAAEPEVAAVESPAAEQPRAADESNVSDELSALVSGPGTSASEQDAAMLWLESLAQKQGAKAEELITNPEDRLDIAPDWVTQGSAETTAAAEPEVVAAAEPEVAAVEPPAVEQPRAADESNVSDELSALVSGPGTSASEQDAAMLWLESLAQKQGAKAEELITNPEDRLDVAPEWVTQGSAEPTAAAEPEVVAAAEPEVAAVESPAAGQPRAADESNVSDELSALVSGPGTSASEQDAAMLWLESLAQKQGAKAEELITNPEDRLDVAPEWVSNESEQLAAQAVDSQPIEQDDSLAWLDELSSSDEPAETSQPVSQILSEPSSSVADEELDWLGDLSKPAGQSDSPLPWEQAEPAVEQAQPVEAASDDTLDWLSELNDDAGEPQAVEQPVVPEAAQPVESHSDAETPDWLSALEQDDSAKLVEHPLAEQPSAVVDADAPIPNASADISAWLNGLADDEAPAGHTHSAQQDDVAAWLADETRPVAEQPSATEAEELPDWLKDMSTDDQPPVPQPVSSWMPSLPEEDDSEETEPEPSEPEPVAAEPVVEPAVPARPVMHQAGALGTDKDAQSVQQARDLLAHGGLNGAMSEYIKLIKKGKLLEEVIYDLQEAVYSHPVDVIVWQTLGDAYFRTNRLQEALDAYSKAEGLLR